MKKIVIISLIILFGCKKNTKEQPDMVNDYFEDNLIYNNNNFKDDLKSLKLPNGNEFFTPKKTQKIENIFYTAALIPAEFFLKKVIKNKDSLKVYKQKTKNERIIQFEFQNIDRKDLLLKEFTNVNYETGVKYLAFEIKNDFFAINEFGDTLQCKGVLFERNFKLAPFKRILLYFNDTIESKSLKLIYKDNLFENGIIKFNLSSK